MTPFDPAAHLDDALLERIRSRAASVDRDGSFPGDDLAELTDAGYLRILVPTALGGAGLTLGQASMLQQRLASAAPATALAVNMHLVWTAVARILSGRGDDALEGVLREAGAGEIFAFGISEPGNDLVLFGSDTDAASTPDGGCAFTGTKIFTSLAPVWTRLGVHGLDTGGEEPALVFAFLHRSERIQTADDWDALGMRGTQSCTTRLDGATARPDDLVRRVPVGADPDPIQFAIFAAFELLVASVYTGVARRALEIAASQAAGRTSKKTGAPRSEDPLVRARVGDMAIRYDALPLELAALTRDVDELRDHGGRWFGLLSGMKDRAIRSAQRIVDDAMLVAGGASYRADAELARLARDVRAGSFHPSSPDSARQTAAAAWLA